MTTQIATAVSNALTGISEPTTMGKTRSEISWPNRLQLKTFNDTSLIGLANAVGGFFGAFEQGLQGRWLTIIGGSGNGKTHCLKWLWKEMARVVDWSRTEYLKRMIYWPDFVDELRDGNAYGEFNDMKRWPVLALDDIGAERDPNGFAAEKLNCLLGCRTERWTIITANKTEDDLAKMDVRIASRMIRHPNKTFVNSAQDFALR